MDDLLIGSPDVQADYSESQIFDDNCAVCAETSIINQFLPDGGLGQEEAAYVSTQNGWYMPGVGTPQADMGNLMELYGIDNHSVTDASIEQLAQELQQGHGVIVSVNSSQLWGEGPLHELMDFICKAFGFDTSQWSPADHAISVTGIDVSDPSNPQVIINDSGMPTNAGAGASYPLDKFLDAWENSDFSYTATDAPLPSLSGAEGFDSQMWGDFDWNPWISDAAGVIGTIAYTAITDDPETGALVGVVTKQITSELLNNEDFARSI